MSERSPRLSAVYAESVRRIARRVAASPAAGRYFAIGTSPVVRTQVATALRHALGEARVKEIHLDSDDADPWATVQSRHTGEKGTLYVLDGLRDDAPEGEAHPYARLNLARDAWGQTATHLLVWLDGPGALDRFLRLAPDLWSHRDYVAWFLSAADFELPAPEDPAGDARLAAREVAARRIIDDPQSGDADRAGAWDELARVGITRGDWIAASEAIDHAVDLTRPADGDLWARRLNQAQARLVVGRESEARRILSNGVWPAAYSNSLAVRRAKWTPGQGEQLRALRALWEVRLSLTEELEADLWLAIHSHLCECGQASEFRTWAFVASRGRADESSVRYWNSRAAALIGDLPSGLASSLASQRRAVEGGDRRRALYATLLAAHSLFGLGVPEAITLADAVSSAAPPGMLTDVEVAAGFRWISGTPGPALEATLSRIAALARRRAARVIALDTIDRLLTSLDQQLPPTDPNLPAVDATLREVGRLAGKDDPEAAGFATFLRARVAEMCGDRASAFRLADGVALAWCTRFEREDTAIDVWCLLARCAPDLTRAEKFARRARTLADDHPSLFVQIDARRTQALVAVRAKKPADAARFLEDARAIARSEGLRPRELLLLHELAETPGHPGAYAAAEAALSLAETIFLPREEARALLNLALLDPTSSLAPRRLARAAELAEELGPPVLRVRVARGLVPTSTP